MKCEDCEFLLAQSEATAAIEEHLRECAACRSIAEELRANAAVLEGLRNEELPRIEMKLPRSRKLHPWAIGAAAAAVLVVGLLLPRQAEPPPPPQGVRVVREEPPPVPVQTRPQKPQQLKIKMLTPDPDVVIYWILD